MRFLLFVFLAASACSCQTRGPAHIGEVRNVDSIDAVAPLRSAPPAAGGSHTLVVTSWNVKRLGRELFDSRQASPMLADADIVAFQEVNSKESGVTAMRAMAAQLTFLTKERMCVAVSEKPTDGEEVYGYIWKNSRVAYVKADGTVMKDCPDSVITVRLGVRHAQEITREPAFGTFFFKPLARPFVLASIHLVPTKKQPQREVPPLFATFKSLNQPVIIAGDYNLSAKHEVFEVAREMGFNPSLNGQKTSLKRSSKALSKAYDDFWSRGFRHPRAPRVINLFETFPEKEPREVYRNFSDHCPITAWFEFTSG